MADGCGVGESRSNEARFKGATTGKPLVITEGD